MGPVCRELNCKDTRCNQLSYNQLKDNSEDMKRTLTRMLAYNSVSIAQAARDIGVSWQSLYRFLTTDKRLLRYQNLYKLNEYLNRQTTLKGVESK